MNSLIPAERSLIPACDVDDIDALKNLVVTTAGVETIGAYKIGAPLALRYGLPTVVELLKSVTSKPIIYDHQKGGTDIPSTGRGFVRVAKDAGCDAIILFALTGPETLETWIADCNEVGIRAIVGVEMTHPRFLATEGGLIDPNRLDALYTCAAATGVSDFVVPGNKPNRIAHYRNLLGDQVVFYAPGFISQGGEISKAAQAAGTRWHAIVGRAIYQSENPEASAKVMGHRLSGTGTVKSIKPQ